MHANSFSLEGRHGGRSVRGLAAALAVVVVAVICTLALQAPAAAQDGGGDGGGSGTQSSGPAASEEAQNGMYGAWTPIINVMKTCIMAAGGVGIATSLVVLATAGPRKDKHELGMYMLEGSSGGVLLALLVDPIYGLLTRLVVGI